MRRYTKFSGIFTTYKRSFSDNFKKMSDKEAKQTKDQTSNSFFHGISDKFGIVTHKVSNTFDWISKKLGFKKYDNLNNIQNTKTNNESIKEKPKSQNDSRNSSTQCEGSTDTTFDINKMGGGTMQGQSRAETNSTKPQSKLDLKFGAGSSYGSSGIGKYSDEKTSSKLPDYEKRTYSPDIESDSQASKPENEPIKDTNTKKK